MTRTLFVVVLLALSAGSASAVTPARSDGAAAQVPPLPPLPPPPAPPLPPPPAVPQLVLKVGDTLRVDGARMGCQVTRRGGRPVLECRRDGSLAGTYGTFMSDRSVTVARFRSSRTAQTILTARHGGRWRACRSAPKGSRLATTSRGCG